MLHSTYYHKDTNEDPKTSAVFENLVLLPDNVIWHIIASSCYDNANIPRHPGMMLSYDFWPHWDKTGTDNKNFVEPDFFMRFENFDVVVEAKFRDVKGQYQHQWEQEITAYLNEYSKESKPLFFIAVGGNNDMTAQKVTVRRQHFYINKCTWPSILVNISRYKKELEKIQIPDMSISSTKRLLDNIILAFNINGVYDIDWFETMAEKKTVIAKSSVDNISKLFELY